MMKYRNFIIFSIIFLLASGDLFKVRASEILTKYNMFYITNPATGLRVSDSSVKDGFAGQSLGNFPGATTSVRFWVGGTMRANTIDPNSPQIGYPDDCYPDDPNNPEGNIVISGKIISNYSNKPINGAVVAVYMGTEHLNNNGNDNQGGAMQFNEKFVISGKDQNGKLTNLYHYDVSKDGEYRVYACNAYKLLSAARKQALQATLFNVDRCPDGYVDTGQGCNFFDYAKAYPKFSLAVVCGMTNTSNSSAPSPIIGEVYSIDNNNDVYKGGNPPSYVQKRNFDIHVNCPETLVPFPIPMSLDYASTGNVASCRMDDVSSNIKNYFNEVQKPLRNYSFSSQITSLAPSLDRLPNCSNPDDIFCLKNFINKSFQKPEIGKNVFDYGSKTYLSDRNTNPYLKQEILKYSTAYLDRRIDLSNSEGGAANERNFLPKNNSATFGQFDAKVDVKSYINDVKFDLSSLKDLYACFTTFNAPPLHTSAQLDELGYAQADRNPNGFYTPNLRIPTCRELYCGQEFVPDNEVCRVKKADYAREEPYGTKVTQKYSDKYIQLNALTGYGPGVTLSLESQKDISLKLLVLVKDLINSDFNPKKPEPGAKYRPVTAVKDIVACMNDDNTPVFLNGPDRNDEGSITYRVKGENKTFYSPVPLMSYISIPYNIELFHSIISDNYKNKYGQTSDSLFPEQCNGTTSGQKFANCRSAIIPGGVYSISALRLIASMCNAATKIPTPDAGNFTRVMGLSGENTSSQINKSIYTNVKDVELSVTRIGTPVSMCLCKSGDYNCSNATKLNNSENPNDFAISSFTGEGGQNNGNNYLGVYCENKFPNFYDKTPSKDCRAIAAANSDKNVPENDVNYDGDKGNLQVHWSYSYADFDQGPDANHEWLSYQWDGGYKKPTPSLTPQTSSSDLKSIASIWKSLTPASLSDGCISGNGSGCLSFPRLTYNYSPGAVSNVESDVGHLNAPDAGTGVAPLTYYDAGAGEAANFVKSPLKVVQKTHDGTVGYVKARFQFQNAVYDPIPDLLNDFRKYSIYGSVPGGDEYCRSPKIAGVFDFSVKDYNVENVGGGGDIIQNRGKGIYCNAAIPEELKRCDDRRNWTTTEEKSPEDCRFYRCMSFCHQLTGTYYLFMDPKTKNYYCLARNTTKGVEMQMNTGDEGCVIDYAQRIKTVYAIPAEVPSDYDSVRNDVRYDKSNYPVYNNLLCQNPSIENPLDPRYTIDGKNCMPFVGKKLIEGSKINNTKFNITTPVSN